MRIRLVVVLALSVVATACGSTIEGSVNAQSGNRTITDDGLGAPLTSTDLGGPEDFGGTGTTAAGSAARTPTARPSGAAASGAASGGASGPGVTAKEVYVGLIHDVNAGAVNQAAGVGAITSGDSKANTQAIIKDINKNGGVGGRTLVPVYAEFDSTSTQTLDQQFAAVCQKFTQDNPRVFAVEGDGVESYRECISKAGVTMLSAGLPEAGQSDLNRYPGFIEQGYPNVDRLAAHYVTPLSEQNYFTPWNTATGTASPAGTVKVGVLTYNDRVFSTAVDRYLVPALKRLGYEPQVARIAPLTTASDIGAQGAAVKSAQLAFAANGVTHVIPFESNGGLSTLFLPTARTQRYFPRYGVSTASGFEALIEAGITGDGQMNGTVGFGWLPSIDLAANDNPSDGPYSNANRRYCLKVMKDNGIVFDSGNAEGIALNSCANVVFAQGDVGQDPGADHARHARRHGRTARD